MKDSFYARLKSIRMKLIARRGFIDKRWSGEISNQSSGFWLPSLGKYVLKCFTCESVGRSNNILDDIKILFVLKYCLAYSPTISGDLPFTKSNTKLKTFLFASMTAIYHYTSTQIKCAYFTLQPWR